MRQVRTCPGATDDRHAFVQVVFRQEPSDPPARARDQHHLVHLALPQIRKENPLGNPLDDSTCEPLQLIP